jgi:hypothetical protein
MNGQITLPKDLVDFVTKYNKLDIIQAILNKKGQIATLSTKRPLKLLSKFRNVNIDAYKVSTFQARIGANYENLASIKEKREDGIEAQPLVGKSFVIHPYILKSDKTGKLYVRLYSIKNNFNRKNEFFVNGVKLEEKQLKDYCLAEEYTEKGFDPVLVDYPLEGVMEIK